MPLRFFLAFQTHRHEPRECDLPLATRALTVKDFLIHSAYGNSRAFAAGLPSPPRRHSGTSESLPTSCQKHRFSGESIICVPFRGVRSLPLVSGQSGLRSSFIGGRARPSRWTLVSCLCPRGGWPLSKSVQLFHKTQTRPVWDCHSTATPDRPPACTTPTDG